MSYYDECMKHQNDCNKYHKAMEELHDQVCATVGGAPKQTVASYAWDMIIKQDLPVSEVCQAIIAGGDVCVEPQSRIDEALDIARRTGGHDGAHHKDWTIDQMCRVLAGEKYREFVKDACDGEDGPGTYTWEVGIPA